MAMTMPHRNFVSWRTNSRLIRQRPCVWASSHIAASASYIPGSSSEGSAPDLVRPKVQGTEEPGIRPVRRELRLAESGFAVVMSLDDAARLNRRKIT
jgi:hypothetical protein